MGTRAVLGVQCRDNVFRNCAIMHDGDPCSVESVGYLLEKHYSTQAAAELLVKGRLFLSLEASLDVTFDRKVIFSKDPLPMTFESPLFVESGLGTALRGLVEWLYYWDREYQRWYCLDFRHKDKAVVRQWTALSMVLFKYSPGYS